MKPNKDQSSQDATRNLKQNETKPLANNEKPNPLDAPELVVSEAAKAQAEKARRSRGADASLERDLVEAVDKLSDSDSDKLALEILNPAAVQRFLAFLKADETYDDLCRLAKWPTRGDNNNSASSVALSLWASLFAGAAGIKYDPKKYPNPFSTRDDFIYFCRKAVYKKLCKRRSRRVLVPFSILVADPLDTEDFSIVNPPDRPHDDRPNIVVDILTINVPNNVDNFHGNFQDSKFARDFFAKKFFLKQTYQSIADEYNKMRWGNVSGDAIARICRLFALEILQNFYAKTQSHPTKQEWTILAFRYVEQESPETVAEQHGYALNVVDDSLIHLQEIASEYHLSIVYGGDDLTYGDSDLPSLN